VADMNGPGICWVYSMLQFLVTPREAVWSACKTLSIFCPRCDACLSSGLGTFGLVAFGWRSNQWRSMPTLQLHVQPVAEAERARR
jgi:hypothetical protein